MLVNILFKVMHVHSLYQHLKVFLALSIINHIKIIHRVHIQVITLPD